MTLWFINEFHLQILVLELLLCRKLPKKKGFLYRLLLLVPLYIVLPLLVPGGFMAPFFRIGEGITFSFLIMILLSAVVLKLLFEISVKQLVFCCCVSHTLQHMVHCLSRVVCFMFHLSQTPSQIVELIFMGAAVLVLYIFLKQERLFGVETAEIKSTQLLAFAVLSSLIVYGISFWSYWNEGENIGEQFFDFLSCLLLLVILLDLFRFRRAEQEQMMLARLLKQEQEQHELSRTTIETINRKCHDLKHQISALRNQSEPEREKSITELEDAILLYDHMAKTGNDDLDIVLAEKMMIAGKQGIRLQCMADGKALSFLRTEDLCSLFGNALDNAIESAAKEPDAAKRIVTLQTIEQGNLLTVHVENPCPQEPDFADGLPVTTKGNTDWHGFGMKSMRYVAEKYGGVLSAGWEQGVFSLDVLFIKE